MQIPVLNSIYFNRASIFDSSLSCLLSVSLSHIMLLGVHCPAKAAAYASLKCYLCTQGMLDLVGLGL